MEPGVSLEVDNIGLGLGSIGFSLSWVEVGVCRLELRFGLGSSSCFWMGLGMLTIILDGYCSEKELSLHKIITFLWWCPPLL